MPPKGKQGDAVELDKIEKPLSKATFVKDAGKITMDPPRMWGKA